MSADPIAGTGGVDGQASGLEPGLPVAPDVTAPPVAQPPAVPAAPPAVPSASNYWMVIGALFVLSIAVAAGVSLITDQSPNAGFVDGAAVLAFVTGIAVGVERILEVVWAQVDKNKTKGTWWPLSLVTEALGEVETKTDELLMPLTSSVSQLLVTVDEFRGTATQHAAAVSSVSQQIQERAAATRSAIANAQRLAPGSGRFLAIARVTDDFTHDAEVLAKEAGVWSAALGDKLRSAGDILSGAQDIVGAFKSNPARKTMSIAMGVPLAIFASGVLGLNMFSAVLGDSVPAYMAGLVGVLATGVVMGLGSNPTHEVIRALQRVKGDSTVEVPVESAVRVTETEVVANGASRSESVMRVAALDGFDPPTVENLGAVLELVSPVPASRVLQTTVVSERRSRPIRNPG